MTTTQTLVDIIISIHLRTFLLVVVSTAKISLLLCLVSVFKPSPVSFIEFSAAVFYVNGDCES